MSTKGSTKCSACGNLGHNRRTCPSLKAPPPESLPLPIFSDPEPISLIPIAPPPGLPPLPQVPYVPPPLPPVSANVVPPRPQAHVEKHVEFLFRTLRPRGLWTTEYRLLDALFQARPDAFHLDETSHYSGTDTAPHDILNVWLDAMSRTKYHLYYVMDRNAKGILRKRYTHLTTKVEGTPVVVARYFLNA